MTQRLFYYGVLPALAVQLIAAYVYFVLLRDSPYVSVVYSIAKIIIFVWPALWLLAKHAPPTWPQPRQAVRSSWYGLLSGIGAATVIGLTYWLLQDELMNGGSSIVDRIRQFGLVDYYLWFALFVSIIHSALEEYYWRWFVFRGLTIRWKPITAAVVSSLAFASHHFIILSGLLNIQLAIVGTIAVFGVGLLWCWIYYKTNSLIGSWLSHIFADFAVMSVGYWMLTQTI